MFQIGKVYESSPNKHKNVYSYVLEQIPDTDKFRVQESMNGRHNHTYDDMTKSSALYLMKSLYKG